MEEGEEYTSFDDISIVTDDSECRSQTSEGKRGRGRKRKREKNTLHFKCTSHLKEDHGQPIFGCQFNWNLRPDEQQAFATVGGNQATIYECNDDGGVSLMQAYVDGDPEEGFYSCAWSHDTESGLPLLAVAGIKGVIRIISMSSIDCVKNLVGHGQSVNELRFHPKNPALLLSVSKDHSLRLWNIKTELCVVIFGGVGGHRDEVLSGDFNQEGTLIASCGMDHSLKLWQLDKRVITETIVHSYKYNPVKERKPFPTCHQNYPDFTTRDIHRNYVDCVRWFGRLILSKSCENTITCWKTSSLKTLDPQLKSLDLQLKPSDNTVSILHEFEFKECDIWFVRFTLDYRQKLMAQGTQTGKVYVWDIDGDDPTTSKPIILTTKKCVSAVRQCHFSRDGSILVCVCDDATILRWNLVL